MKKEQEGDSLWIIFIYASTEAKERRKQWELLMKRKSQWGSRWILEGDFNDIRNNEEKKGGRHRQESSFHDFRNFISEMQMGKIKLKGKTFTWANNTKGEGFIQERLDRFFGSAEWMIEKDTVEIKHILRQASDHSLLKLDTLLLRRKTKERFIFEHQWIKE